LQEIAVDGCITKAPGGGECAGRSPVDRSKQGMKRSSMVEGHGIPLDRVLAAANRHDSPLLAATLDKLDDLGPLPDDIRVHLDAGCDSQKTRDELAARGMTGQIARKGDKAPIQASQRWLEQTFGWIMKHRRCVRDYERLPQHHETYLYWSMIHVMAARTARRQSPASSATVPALPQTAPARTLLQAA
jgi:hypothetical protein